MLAKIILVIDQPKIVANKTDNNTPKTAHISGFEVHLSLSKTGQAAKPREAPYKNPIAKKLSLGSMERAPIPKHMPIPKSAIDSNIFKNILRSLAFNFSSIVPINMKNILKQLIPQSG